MTKAEVTSREERNREIVELVRYSVKLLSKNYGYIFPNTPDYTKLKEKIQSISRALLSRSHYPPNSLYVFAVLLNPKTQQYHICGMFLRNKSVRTACYEKIATFDTVEEAHQFLDATLQNIEEYKYTWLFAS